MYVYIVAIRKDGYIHGVSGEGYNTLTKAQEFIESRSDAPRKRSDFQYESDQLVYEILEVRICH